jgi:3-methyladenine DNA glycosylase AlkD
MTQPPRDAGAKVGASAAEFERRLDDLRSPDEQRRNERNLKTDDADVFIGVRMGSIFALAKELMNMVPREIETLLESPVHEVRVGAVSVMDWQARSRATTPERRRQLFDLYIRRHDRINAWDLVDRSAIWVVGDYLRDKPRDVLYRLARSESPSERRTAILSTAAFIRQGDLDDTVAIAELLRDDPHELVRKAVGWMLREVGKVDERRLRVFLDSYAGSMPRVMLRYAIEKLDPDTRKGYLGRRA